VVDEVYGTWKVRIERPDGMYTNMAIDLYRPMTDAEVLHHGVQSAIEAAVFSLSPEWKPAVPDWKQRGGRGR
jgi:hypothetical protein